METMDDPNFNPFSSERHELKCPDGPFRRHEELPRQAAKWKGYVDPVTKQRRLLIDYGWQVAAMKRITDSLKDCTQTWTLGAVKKRENLDAADRRDFAQSLFMMDPFAEHQANATILRALYQAPAPNATANAIATAAAALITAQDAAIDALVADIQNPVVEANRLCLNSYCALTAGELGIFQEFVRVYQEALCHFLFQLCNENVSRFLNAERVKSLNLQQPVTLEWTDYITLLSERMQDGSKSNDILTYFEKRRESGLTIYLWISERRAERALLEHDQVRLPERTWLAYVLHFVSPDERDKLNIPAEKDMAGFNNGNGYTMAHLETAVTASDPLSFKPFRPNQCRDPLAKRIMALHAALDAAAKVTPPSPPGKGNLTGKKKPDPKVNFDLSDGKPDEAKKLVGAALKALDLPASLPQKDGKPDTARIAKFHEKSLRRRVFNAVLNGNCARCNGKHVRSKCTADRHQWEEDYDKGPSFWAIPLQARAQWSAANPSSSMAVLTELGLFGLDTQSDVSTCLPSVLAQFHTVDPVTVCHLSGTTVLATCGTLQLPDCPPIDAFAVPAAQLPPGMVGIMGMPAIVRLGISLDHCLSRATLSARNPFANVDPPYLSEARDPTTPSWLRNVRAGRHWTQNVSPGEIGGRMAPVSDTDHPLPFSSVPVADVPSFYRSIGRMWCVDRHFNQTAPADTLDSSFSTDDVAAPPALWNPFYLLTVLAILFALALRPAISNHSPGRALLPGNQLGHSLFASPPYASRSDIVWALLTESPTPYCEPASFDPQATTSSLCRDPPEFYEVPRPVELMCYMQNVQPSSSPSSSSSFTGGRALRARIHILPDGHPEPFDITAGIDTLSDVSLAPRDLLSDVHPISPDSVRGSGHTATFSEEGLLDIMYGGRLTRIPALVASEQQLPALCQVLLGVPAISDLGVALDDQLKQQDQPLICHLGEKSLRTWWDANAGQSVDTKPFDIASIDICPDLPAPIQARIRAFIQAHAVVFQGSAATLPKPFDVEPIVLKFKSDARPQSIPEPRWSYAYGKIVQKWAEDGLANGSLELSDSAWASRAHIVLKAPSGVTASEANIPDCKLRVTGDYRLVNTQIEKRAPNLPTGTHQVERAAGHAYYFESDSVACYNSFRLAQGESREALAIWTPIGLVQPTVLPFGQKNSGTEAQGPYRAASRSLTDIANYVDDWLGFSNCLTTLCDNFEAFLLVCQQHGITLNTGKTRFGYPSANFFGFLVDISGTCLSPKHLDPIRKLVAPVDISELRRVLGLFVVSRRYIKDYAILTKPLTDLLRGRQPVFSWGLAQQTSFETVRDLLLGGIHIAAPDYSIPFHLATDASEDGKGAVLYQLPTVPLDKQHPHSVRIHNPQNTAVVQFLSKAWNESQRNRPPFYLEADALLWSTDKCKFYALSSPFPLYTYSDHLPLQWMNASTKGPVSQFLIENLSEIETIHQYISGPTNSIADAASRYPMLGPRRLAPRGLTFSVQQLLQRLPARLKHATAIHVHAGSDTPNLRAAIQIWSAIAGAVTPNAPVRRGAPPTADLAIMIPRPETAPVSLALYLLSQIPFAFLIPIDLLSQTYKPKLYPDAPSARIETLFQKAGKITLLSTQMTWVIGNIQDCAPIETFAMAVSTPAPSPYFDSNSSELYPGSVNEVTDTFADIVPQTIEDWIVAQEQDPSFPELVASLPASALRQGLQIFAPDNAAPLILVPEDIREPLVRLTHRKMFHLGSAKVTAVLKKMYYWPTLAADTKRLLADCPDCELEKARQNTAHGMFSARPFDAPRARYAMDFAGQGTADTGETEALAIIDTTSRYVTVLCLPDREATTFIQPFLDRVVFIHGPPAILHSDAAPEFMSEVVALLAAALETDTTTTLGHNARGNSTVEVFWRYWSRCMRILPDAHYRRWPQFASRIVFAYNTAVHESIGAVSPYEVYHGVPARNPFTAELHRRGIEDELPALDLSSPDDFATAVKTSVAAFVRLAQNHTAYVRQSTAARLNEHGHPRSYAINDRVKIRIPPSHEMMIATGRKSSHLASWRGPMTITDRLSATGYSMTEISTGRSFERAITNILPYRATSARSPAVFDPAHAEPFVVSEIIAVRDEPDSPVYLAKVTSISANSVHVHYHGSHNADLARAVFYPCWHPPDSNYVILAGGPSLYPPIPAGHVPYTGELQFNSLRDLLMARNLEFTAAHRLRRKSQRALAAVSDEIFLFEH